MKGLIVENITSAMSLYHGSIKTAGSLIAAMFITPAHGAIMMRCDGR